MSVYRYSGDSAIAEVRFHYADGRAPVALLSAREGVSAAQLASVRHTLEAANMQCVPVLENQHAVLQVNGFTNTDQLLAVLSAPQFVRGQPNIQVEAGDEQTRSWRAWLRRYSLKTVGWLNIIGDITLLISGTSAERGSPKRKYHIPAGLLYTAGATAPALFGEAKPEEQENGTVNVVANTLRESTVIKPDSSLRHAELAAETSDQKSQSFFHRHAAQIMLALYAAGAAVMLRKGLKIKYNKAGDPDLNGKHDMFAIVYGVNSLILKTLAFVLPERPARVSAEEENTRGPISRAFHWLIDKPLRLFGIGSFVSDIALGCSSYARENAKLLANPKAGRDYWMWTTVGTYLAADVLASISSKNPENVGVANNDHQRRVAALAAETIAQQPEAVREGLVDKVAVTLSTRADMGGDAKKIRHTIEEQMQHLAANPWAQRLQAESSVAAEPVKS